MHLLILLATPGCTLILGDGTYYDADGDRLDWNIDCDDNDPAVGLPRIWYPDSDGDGLGDYTAPSPSQCFPPDSHYVENRADCNDLDPTIGETIWYADMDGDGYGNPNRATSSCTQPDDDATWVSNSGDCNDTSDQANPSKVEICGDLLDNNCDGQFDEDGARDAPSWYYDGDGDSYGDDLIEPVDACASPGEDYVERAGDCDDSEPGVNPSANEICGNGLDDDCDELGEPECGVTSGSVSSSVQIEGSEGSELGWSGVVLDSVDGDSSPDLLLGAYGQGGAVYLIPGPLSDDISLADGVGDALVITGDSEAMLLGWAVAQGNDLTGDGEPDLLFGAPGAQNNRGAAYVMPGPMGPGQATTDQGIALVGSLLGDLAGFSVSGIGNGDLLVGAPQTGLSNFGTAYLIQGPLTGTTLSLSDVGVGLHGAVSGDQAGAAVAPARDVNGDGAYDMVIGAPYVDDGESSDVGAVYLILGPVTADMDLQDADLTLLGESQQGQAGLKLSPGGDIYQFQETTLLVGAPTATNAKGEPAGRSYILSNQTLLDNLKSPDAISLSQADAVFIGNEADDEAATIAGAGDLDGDGRDDVAIGAPGTTRGRVYVWYGHFSLQGSFELTSADAILQGRASGDALGFSLSGGYDLDMDGYEDLLIGAWGYDGTDGASPNTGAAYVVRGGPGE